MVAAIAIAAGLLHYSFSGDKPPCIDEPLNIYGARQALKDPVHPHDYTVYRGGIAITGSRYAIANPVWPAILSLPLAAFGEKPEALHLAMIPFTSLAIFATGIIAESLGIPAIPAALLASISPICAMFASSLMPDLPAIAAALLALLVFMRPRLSPAGGALGAILIIAASLLRISSLVFFPVIAIAGLFSNGRNRTLLWLIPALAGSLIWPVANLAFDPDFWAGLGSLNSWIGPLTPGATASRAAYVWATLAGAVVHPGIWWVLWGARLGRPGRANPVITGALSLSVMAIMVQGGAWQSLRASVTDTVPFAANITWFACAGFAFLAWIFAVALETRGRDASTPGILLFWILLGIAGALSSPAISAHPILFVAPAVLLLVVRDISGLLDSTQRRISACALACGTIWLANSLVQADMRSAQAPGSLLENADIEMKKIGIRGVLATDGGFQYQGLNRGMLLFARDPGTLAPGRAIFITSVAPMHIKIPAGMKFRKWLTLYSEAPDIPLRTMLPRAAAGFWRNGCLPYSFSTDPVEKVVIVRISGNIGKD